MVPIRSLLVVTLALLLVTGSEAAPFAEWLETTSPGGRPVRIWGEGDEYAAHFEKRLSDYEQTFETRQKEYVEFFKRELDALERRAKAADEARVETEARLSRIAAALRG